MPLIHIADAGWETLDGTNVVSAGEPNKHLGKTNKYTGPARTPSIMTITAEVHLRSSLLPLVSVAELEQTDDVQCPHVLGLEQGLQMFVVEIDAAEPLSKEDLLALDEVIEATELGSARGKEVFKLTVVLRESVAEAFEDTPDAGLVDAIRITPEGWYEKKVSVPHKAPQLSAAES